jgi:hypothetical protein
MKYIKVINGNYNHNNIYIYENNANERMLKLEKLIINL